ncbi:hypothetical protein [Agromyces sp. H66]|uniref:hypothetical protein n=1 Tax=Agromyces sp. H66 TaxID=2529859 RepID=UPI0010AACD8E|nr:hypothetical protein [Agromyces sp. H66]
MSPPTRLVLIEGSIGAGKTTATAILAEQLRADLAGTRVGVVAVAEGDVDHPADLERVAAVDEATFDALLEAHPIHADALRAVASPSTVPGVRLVRYGVLERDHRAVPASMVQALAAHDAYELALLEHVRHRMAHWREFVRRVGSGTDVWVLDCCAIQNPVTVALVRDDAPIEVSVDLVTGLLDAAATLSPVVVHLRPSDPGAAFERAVAERPAWWRDHVIGYYTGRRLGRRLNATGVEGTVEVLRHRAEAEEQALAAAETHGVRVSRVTTDDADSVEEALASISAAVAAGWSAADDTRT